MSQEKVDRGKRSGRRLPCRMNVTIRSGIHSFKGICVNLSGKGMGLEIEKDAGRLKFFTVIIEVTPHHHVAISSEEKFRKRTDDHLYLGVKVENPEHDYQTLYSQLEQMVNKLSFDPLHSDLSQPFQYRVQALHNKTPFQEPVGQGLKVVGPFEIIKKLGMGMIGASYLVRKPDETLVVLKVIHTHHLKTERTLNAWKNYLHKIQELHHDYLVPILEIDVLPNGKNLYYTMPYYAAGSLEAYTQKMNQAGNQFHHSYVLRWGDQLAHALETLHQKNVTHANVKPSNLLLNDEGKIELADFFPPFAFFDQTAKRQILKMNPKFFMSATIIDLLADRIQLKSRPKDMDIYSFGSILGYLFTGEETIDPKNPIFEDQYRNKNLRQFLLRCHQAEIKDATSLLPAFRSAFRPGKGTEKRPEPKPEPKANPAPTRAPKVAPQARATFKAMIRSAWLKGYVEAPEIEHITTERIRLNISAADADLIEHEVKMEPEIRFAQQAHQDEQLRKEEEEYKNIVSESQEIRKLDLPWLIDAIIYPTRGFGPLFIVLGTLFLGFAQFTRYSIFSSFGSIIIGGYLCAYYMKVIASSGRGEHEPPDWPEIRDVWDDVVVPFFQINACFLVAWAPALFFAIVVYSPPDYFEIQENGTYYADSDLEERDPNVIYQDDDVKTRNNKMKTVIPEERLGFLHSIVFWVLLLLGSTYLPIALIGVSLSESINGLNPIVMIPSIFLVFIDYAVVYTSMVIIYVVAMVSSTILGFAGIIGIIISSLLVFYLCMILLRMMGLLYYRNEDKLTWF